MPDRERLVVDIDADTDAAEEAIEGLTLAVEDLGGALEDVDAALRRIDSRELSISIELQPRPADETGDSTTDTEQ